MNEEKKDQVVITHVWYEALPSRKTVGIGVKIGLALVLIACTISIVQSPSPNLNIVGTYSLAASVTNPEEFLDNTSSIEKKSKKILKEKTQLFKETNASCYQEWMWYLKSREGYVPEKYYCPAGKNTIGYGHNIDAHGKKSCSKFLSGNRVSYHSATQLLVKDVEDQYKWLLKKVPHLSRNQALAVTSLLLNCGSAKIQFVGGKQKNGYSVFWKNLINGKTPNFVTYNKYKTPEGEVVTSTNLTKSRKFEQVLFEGDINKVKQLGQYYRSIVINRDIKLAKKEGLYY